MAKKNTDPWALNNWQKGSVTLFSALGLSKLANAVDWKKLTPQANLTENTGKADEQAGANAANAAASGAASLAPGSSGPCNSAQTNANKKLMQQAAAKMGWTGQQWTDLNNIIMAESGYCNTIKNPTSTAYGIGQFLDSTWSSVGGTKTSDAQTQIDLTLKYIKQRYGDPSKAWAFHVKNGWY